VRLVPGAQYAGITLARRRREIETPAATGNYPPLLDEIQQRYGEGPCLSAAWRHHRVRIDDLATDAAAAFGVLKRLSQESNTPVAEIAQRLLCADRRRL
jgi:hypothetical protein